jgi:BASS family bile acid:Na+ symporter
MDFMEKLGKVLNRYFSVLIIAVAAIGLLQPRTFLWIVPDISAFLGVIMFGMGITLKKEDFKEVFTRPKDVFMGVAAHYCIMPCVAYILCLVLKLPKELAVGVILVGCCPSGTASNVMCYIGRGDLALSVCIGAVSTILAPFLMPILILLLAGWRSNKCQFKKIIDNCCNCNWCCNSPQFIWLPVWIFSRKSAWYE